MNTKRNLIQICLLGAVLLQALTSAAQPVTKIAAAGNFLFLKSDGSLWVNSGTNLVEIVASNVTAIATGEDPNYLSGHSLFLKSDGSLWAMGGNQDGQLGDGTTNNVNIPEMIASSNVTAVAAGSHHSLFLKNDGSLWAMGFNADGQLGDGTTNNVNLPEMIVASNVTAIAAGYYHSLFLKNDGSLWGMGLYGDGQLGDGMGNEAIDDFTNLPVQIVASNVTAVAGGGHFSLFLKSDGSLWGMGFRVDGELGDGYKSIYPNLNGSTNLPEQIVASGVTTIAAGFEDSLFLKSDGSLWGMGNEFFGQLGDGTYGQPSSGFAIALPEQIVSSGVTAIAAGQNFSLFIKNDGSLWGMGFGTNVPTQLVAGPPGYNQISAQLLSCGNVSLSYMGLAGTNYVLEQSFSLSPANWIPQITNSAGVGGILVFTNTPDPNSNNFWRIRSVP